MNAERLHALLKSLSKEFIERKTAEKVITLSVALTELANNSTTATQEAFVTAKEDVETALTDSASDCFSPTWQQALKEIRGNDLCGKTLADRIENTIQSNQLTPAVCAQKITEISEDFRRFTKAVRNGIFAFEEFGIGAEELGAGECEIGILIPRDAVDGKLYDFGKELQNLTYFFDAISEVSTGKKDPLHIRSISSSELLVFLVAGFRFCKCLAETVGTLVDLYKKVLELKQARNDYLKKGIPENIVKQVEEHANTQMQEDIHKLSVKVVEDYYKGETGRKNELTVFVERSLGGLADRIDRGYNIEIRIEQIIASSDEKEDEKAEQERLEFQKAVESIRIMAPNMQYLKTEGKPILMLSEEKTPKEKQSSGQSIQKQTVKKAKKVSKKASR